MLLFTLLSYQRNVGDVMIKQGLEHRKDALHKEDLFMAEHLISEGFKVLPPK